MDTTLTSGNLQSFLRLLDEKRVTPQRFTAALSDGRLADILDEDANYGRRDEVRKLLGLGSIVLPKPEFKPFMTLKGKAGTTPDDYRKSFKKKKIQISGYADQILNKIGTSAADTEIDVVKVSGAELGFKKAASRQAIYDRAIGFGFEKCPTQIGPQFRDEYADKQPRGEWIIVGSDPLADSDGGPFLFLVGRSGHGELWLDTCRGSPDDLWDPDLVWLFVLPRK